MAEKIRLCPPIDTEVDTMNQVRRTFRQINKCLAITVAEPTAGQTLTAHDHTGGTEVAGTPLTVPLDKVDTDTGDLFDYDTTNHELMVNEDAVILFNFRVSCQAEEFACVRVWLEEDMGGGFTEVDGTRAYLWLEAVTP